MTNTKKLTINGRDPARTNTTMGGSDTTLFSGVDVGVRAYVAIPEESLYDDELFVRYCLAEAKINIGRLLRKVKLFSTLFVWACWYTPR